jgi:lysophospholipase L1-like esterase
MKNFTLERSIFSRPQSVRLPKKSIPLVALKSGIAIALSLFAWELIVRNTIEQSPGTTKHPVLGRIYNPGDRIESGEGYSRTKMNSLGMRGDEIPTKANGEFRVVSLGDSFTSAEQMADSKTYNALTESALRSQKLPATIVNAGRSGATPAHYLHLADFYKDTFQPDVVVVQINDSDFSEEGVDPSKEFYIHQEGGQFKTVHNQGFASDDRLSQLFQQKLPQLGFLLRVSTVRVGGRNLQSMLKSKSKPAAEPIQPNTKNYDDLVEWTVTNLKAKYPKLIIVHIPYVTFNNPDEPANPPEAALIKMAKKHNVPILAMREDFVNYHLKTRQATSGFNNTIPGTGHTNEAGHELIAKRLAPMLKAMQNNQ